MKNIFLKLFLISIIYLISPSKELSLDGILNINKLFNSMIFSPIELLFTLTKSQLEKTDVDFSCTLCQRVTNAVTTTIREKYGYEGIEYYAELLCSLILDRGVCNSYISKYGPYFIDSFILRAGNEENLCHKLGFCFDSEDTEDTYDYAIRLLKDKPKNKKREGVDYTAPTLKMLQLTDIHLDVKYIENGTAYCDEPVCCRTPASTYSRIKSGKFGFLGRCDASIALLDTFMEKAEELKPDFIIWTGDNSPHNSKNSTQQDNYDATTIVKDKLNEKFKNEIPIYPALGNHEKFPSDLYIGDEAELLENYAQIFKDYFYEDQAFESFRKYGYYTEKYKNTNLRIIVINCLLCDTWNFYVIGGRHDAAKKEFIWLEEVLRQAEKDGEFIYIIDHFPINSNFQLTECAHRFRALFDRFDYIIRGYFSGHTHYDDISPVKAYFEPKPIININYIAPPLTPYPGRHPSFRLFILDSNTKNVIDYQQYRLNITDANLKGVADWHIAYNATELFNVSDLTQLEDIFKIDVDGEYIKQRYAEGKNETKIIHNKKEIRTAQCQIETDNYHDYYVCNADTIFSADYLFEFLNDLSGEWPTKPEN